MDAFELIRREAERLHGAVVSNGAAALDPYPLVLAAAAHLDLDIYWLPTGDPALKGGRALFDDQSGAILCENVEDPIERAQLLAHEIGHAKLHTAGGSCTENDIDPSSATEAAPVGLQRVEDYGARERRELQANVFGRELLLPRGFARDLHIRDGQSASTLAKRTGLPIALIRQQLFDALLLPAWPQENVPQSQEAGSHRTDPGQDRAAAHRGSAFQLQAGPGTGKTRTLIRRVTSLVAEGVDPASILVLTFSNRAAGELSERLITAIPEAAPRLWIGTFHAFGLDLVRRHYDRLGLCPHPGLFDRSDAIAVLEEILPTLPLQHYRNLWDPAMVLKDIISAISRAKDELVDAAAYRQLAQQMSSRQPNGKARGPSAFLDWLPPTLVETVPQPAQLPLPADAPRPQPITITWAADWQLTDSRLGSYEKCPRRFLYTHVLRLGGARKTTAFSQTHDCLYHLLRWMGDQRKTDQPTIEEAEAAFANIWQEHGPTAHAFAQDYRRLASRLVGAFVASGAGRRFRDSEPLVIDFPNGQVIVEPSEIAELPDGSVAVRRVRTGHKRSDEYDRLEYTLYQLAAQARFGVGVMVQALHLTDGTAEAVAITATKVKNRQENAIKMLAGIAAGRFDPEPDAVTCPRCPHFFACPALAGGALDLT